MKIYLNKEKSPGHFATRRRCVQGDIYKFVPSDFFPRLIRLEKNEKKERSKKKQSQTRNPNRWMGKPPESNGWKRSAIESDPVSDEANLSTPKQRQVKRKKIKINK